MSITHQKALLVAVMAAVLGAVPEHLAGQARNLGPRPEWADSTPVRIMSRANGFPSADVLEVLRQRHQTYSAAKRRELADLVAQRAIADPRFGRPAIEAIAMSGSSDPGLGGIPDHDALDRLIQVQKTAKSADERHLALIELIDQVNPARALPYLRQLATSTNEDEAYWALVQISRLAFGVNTSRAEPSDRSQAQALLRELYDQHLITTGRAARLMCETAVSRKWSVARGCGGIL